MTADLCGLWREFVANPRREAVAAAIRAAISQILEHLDDCEACAKASDAAAPQNLEAIYEVLAAADETALAPEPVPEERAVLEEMLTFGKSHEAYIEHAVTDGLLPALSKKVRESAAKHSPRTLFTALETVAMAIHRAVRRASGSAVHVPSESVELFPDGRVVSAEGKTLIGADDLTRALAEACRSESTAGADEMDAQALLALTYDAARSLSTAFIGLDSFPLPGRVALTLVPRTGKEDLYQRWSPTESALRKEAMEQSIMALT